ncbi:hypothetical protein CK203_015344 [Vitis vinifera]|uniref:Uncharacterized protein n=1 Tax=Vitis vinifera TaxID=29760 RepID=A0A438JJZ7_VITVI|nr:hypothetical protein CK203_015344 [Vitis vinifera]
MDYLLGKASIPKDDDPKFETWEVENSMIIREFLDCDVGKPSWKNSVLQFPNPIIIPQQRSKKEGDQMKGTQGSMIFATNLDTHKGPVEILMENPLPSGKLVENERSLARNKIRHRNQKLIHASATLNFPAGDYISHAGRMRAREAFSGDTPLPPASPDADQPPYIPDSPIRALHVPLLGIFVSIGPPNSLFGETPATFSPPQSLHVPWEVFFYLPGGYHAAI